MVSILQPNETGYNANQVRNVKVSRKEYRFKGVGLYGQMIDAFSRCILRNEEPPITLADGRRSVALVEAIYRAVKKKQIVHVKAHQK